MPDFGNNSPGSFGRQSGRFVPFKWRGYDFPQGVAPDLVQWFTVVLDAIAPHITGGIHPGGPDVAGTWGGEVRANVNDPSQRSFHEFGMAIDVNAPWNGNGSGAGGHGQWQVGPEVAAIVRSLGGLHGGEWGDPMHIECHLHTSEVAAWNAAHGGGGGGNTPAPQPAHSTFPLPDGTYYFGPLSGPAKSISGMAPSGSDAKYRPAIARVQQALDKHGLGKPGAPAQLLPDGQYGPHTIGAVKWFQAAHGLPADGLTGPRTWAALGL